MGSVVIIRETLLKSIFRDVVSTAMAFALILPGVFVGSAAMQWAGFVAFLIIVGKWAKQLRGSYDMSIQDARKMLDELEAANDP